MGYKIAIDGPASSGKSTVAKIIAKELGYIYVDTGAMYRAVALYLINNKIDYNNEEEIKKVLDKIDITIEYDKNTQIVKLNNKNVNDKIRTNEVSNVASICSVFKDVRKKLVSLQQKIAKDNSVVMDGRDIATRVLPDANLKIFLSATVACRANRRYKELIEKGQNVNYEDIEKDLKERDYRDTHRENDPLIKVEDAHLIDTTNMNVDDVVDEIINLAVGKA